MVVQEKRKITKEVLLELRKSIIGDQNSKFIIYKEHRDLIEAVIEYDRHLSLKLDVLLILAHLDKGSCKELGRHGTELFVRILGMEIPNDSDVEDIAKYVKLRRICIENCTEAETNEQFFFQEFYDNEPLNVFKASADQLVKTDEAVYRDIVIEYMRYLSTLPFVITSPELVSVLREIIYFYVDKYLPTVNFKYTMVTSAKERYEAECDVFYDPNNTSAELLKKMNNYNSGSSSSGSSSANKQPCFDSLPQCMTISDPFDMQLIFVLSNLLTVLQSGGTGQFAFLADIKINIFYASLVRHPDIRLKTSALSFFYCQLGDSWFAETRKDDSSSSTINNSSPFPIKLWIPTLISTLNEPELPQFFSPLAILSSLATEFTIPQKPENIVIDTFFDSNLLNGMIDTFLRLLSMEKQNTDKLQLLADYLKFFSEIIGKDERCRLLFLENVSVLQYMENAFSSHLLILNNFREDWPQLKKLAPLPALFDSELVTNWAKCLKACSRSVGVLRTSLKRNKLAEYTLKLAREVYEIVSSTYTGDISHLLSQELVLLGELLGAMSNFVVEFSSLRTLMKKNGIIELIKNIFADPVFNTQYLDRAASQPIDYSKAKPVTLFQNEPNIYSQIIVIQTNSLWVLRHLIYNSETCDKLELLSEIDLESILQFVHSTDPSVLNQCFQLLRNLTCNSRKVINMILDKFKNVNVQNPDINDIMDTSSRSGSLGHGNNFLKFLAFKLRTVLYDDSYFGDNKLAEALLYIVVNFTAINENKRNLVIAQDDLLNIVKEYILVEKSDEITKACLWIVTNLIWDSSIQNVSYNNTLSESGNPHFESDWGLHSDNNPIPTRNDDPITRMPLSRQGSGMLYDQNGNTINDDNDDDENNEEEEEEEELDDEDLESKQDDDSMSIYKHILETHGNTPSGAPLSPAFIRFKKLDSLGFDEAVKKILDWNGDLDVKERAKTLLYQMETFRKSSIPAQA